MGYTLLGDSDVLERKITNWVSALLDIFLCVLPLRERHAVMHYNTREHLFSHVRVRIKRKLRPGVGISPSQYTHVHSQ